MQLKLILEQIRSKIYRDVTHGTSIEKAKKISKFGFKLPKRNALFFDSKGLSGKLHQVYGSDALIIADLHSKKPIKMQLVKGMIFGEMNKVGITINEPNVHRYLYETGYDLIDNRNELIVLDPTIIKIKDIRGL